MTDVTFVRTTGEADPGGGRPRSIWAVPTSDLGEAVGDLTTAPGVDLDAVPSSALPGVADLVAGQIAPRVVLAIGTSVGDRWTSWHPPVPAPPVPR